MRIAILGTRGIPNNYGGFEAFAENLSLGLVKNGHEVFVYNSHNHPYREKIWNGVNIIHCYDPESRIGTAGQFIYDFNCILDSRCRKFDVILQLGYTSSSVWGRLLPSTPVIITNMDGLEWKRTKYSPKVRKFLKYAERLAIKTSDVLVADSTGIQKYLKEEFNKESVYIPYGAKLFTEPDESVLLNFGLEKYNFDMLIARLEPENNIETILDGLTGSDTQRKFLVIGNNNTTYGRFIKDKYRDRRIIFPGAIYDNRIIDNLRYFSNLYFHGHSVGGTNPSLLEAMATSCLVCAHNNIFNKSILADDAIYFNTKDDIKNVLESYHKQNEFSKIEESKTKISTTYSWPAIVSQYENLFLNCKKLK